MIVMVALNQTKDENASTPELLGKIQGHLRLTHW